jgi:ceramide glucosyltransferase
VTVLPWLGWLLTAAAIAYQWAAVRALSAHLRQPRPSPITRPGMSVLKPLCGAEPGLAENLAATLAQAYPTFQVVVGVASPEDSALAALPPLGFELVVNGDVHGANLKISNLLNMLPSASQPVVVFADSDVRPDPGWLDDIAAALEEPAAGMVTSLYVGRPDATLWSRLGAMAINHGFLPSALVARRLGRVDGCFGATMALPRDYLTRIGGLEPLAEVLADDWRLGAMVRQAGRSIALTARPVDLMVGETDLPSLLAHEIRWGRTVAAVDRWGHLGSIMTQPLAVGLLGVACGAGPWPLLAGLVARAWAIRAQEKILKLAPAPLGLLALREGLSLVVFFAACLGRSVLWRGRRYRIRRDGTLEFASNG